MEYYVATKIMFSKSIYYPLTNGAQVAGFPRAKE
jgi:hypothetical protein